MKISKLSRRCEFCKVGLLLLLLLVVGFALAWQFVPASASNQLTIAVGATQGAYYDYVVKYQQDVKAEGVELKILSVAGSVEALQTVRDGKADLALVQGGVAYSTQPDAAAQGLSSIAGLFYEPLWVFYRKEIGDLTHLNTLRDKRISIAKQGSGTQVLVSQLLDDNGINHKTATLFPLLMDAAKAKLQGNELDVMFLMTQPDDELVKQLISNGALGVMDFQQQALTYTTRYPFLRSIVIGEGLIDLKHNLPERNITLLSTTATLVAKKDLHPDHVRLFSREVLRVHSSPSLLATARQFPSIDHLEIPVNPTAAQYIEHGPSFLEKIFPFWLAARIDQLKVLLIPLVTLLLPLSKGILPLYQWRIRSRIFPWYKTLSQLDRQLDGLDLLATEQAIQRLYQLHSELAQNVSVPLAHMPEFYQLRTHADHILQRLQARRSALQAQSSTLLTSGENLSPPVVPVIPPLVETSNLTVTESVSTPLMEPISNPAVVIQSAVALPVSTVVAESASQPQVEEAVTPPPKRFNASRLFSLPRIRPPVLIPDPAAETVGEPSSQESASSVAPTPTVPVEPLPPAPDPAALAFAAMQRRQIQQRQAYRIVRRHVWLSIGASAIPLPVLDIAVLTATQLHLLEKLSQHYGVAFNRQLAKEKLLALLSGIAPATTVMGLSQASKLIPGIGTVLGGVSVSALSGALVYAVGKIWIKHFAAGGTWENFEPIAAQQVLLATLQQRTQQPAINAQ